MAIARDSTGSYSWFASTSSPSYTHTPVGSPNFVIVGVFWRRNGTQNVTGVTYGGNAMTSMGVEPYASSPAGAQLGLWRLDNPPSGAQTVAVTLSAASARGAIVSIAYTGVDTAASTSGYTQTKVEPASSITRTVTSATGDLVLAFFGCHTDAITHTEGGGQTQVVTAAANGGGGSDSGYRLRATESAGAASVVVDWTLGSSDHAVEAAFSLKAAAGGADTFTRMIRKPIGARRFR